MAIAGQIYSGMKYQVLLGRQTAASSAVNMGTAGSTNSEFVELDMASVSDIDFAGGLVTDRTLRTGQQVKRGTDHWVSEKGSTKSFNFEWVVSHKEGLQMLLEMVTEDTSSPYAVAGNVEPPIYNHGASTGKLATIILKNLDANAAATQFRTMHSAALTNLSLSMDATSNGGRLIASGTFVSGYNVSTATSSVTNGGTQTPFVKTIHDCTTKTVNAAEVVVKAFSMEVGYPMVRVGYQGSDGEPEMYSRAGEITCSGSITVLYDTNADGFLAEFLTNPAAGSAAGESPIVLSDNATVGSGNFAFEVLQAVFTGHNLSMEGAEEGMMLELPFEGTAIGAENLFRVDID